MLRYEEEEEYLRLKAEEVSQITEGGSLKVEEHGPLRKTDSGGVGAHA